MSWTGPANPVNVPLRPLDKGMVLDRPTVALPPGAGLDIRNYHVTPFGLRRRPAVKDAIVGALTPLWTSQPAEIVEDAARLWQTDGSEDLFLITNKFLYQFPINDSADADFTGIYWTKAGNYSSLSGTTFTDSGENFYTDHILDGDIVAIKLDDDTYEYKEIYSRDSTTQLTLVSAVSGTPNGDKAYIIYRAFGAREIRSGANDYARPGNDYVDYTRWNDQLLLVDGTERFIYTTDGSTLSQYATSESTVVATKTIEYFEDRVWIANTLESDGEHRTRIRWTNALTAGADFTSFPAANYVDLPYTPGQILRLVPLGSLLVVYLDDSIYIGRPANFANLPLVFTRVDMGGVSLVGAKAITSWIDGHYFVGPDDIYYLSASAGIKRIGSVVLRETVRNTSRLDRVYVEPDPENDRVVFGFPRKSEQIMTRFWSFNYKTNAWSYDTIMGATAMFRQAPIFYPTFDTIDSFTETDVDFDGIDSYYSTFDSAMGSPEERRLYFVTSDYNLLSLPPDGSGTGDGDTDNPSQITAIYESGDIDFGAPDTATTVLRLSMKIYEEPGPKARRSSDLIFNISVCGDMVESTNSWKRAGQITIPARRTEGFVHFRLTSSTFRFRVESSNLSEPYTIEEFVLRIRGVGLESHLRSSE